MSKTATKANDQIRDRLKEIRSQLDEKRETRATQIQERDAAKEAFATSGVELGNIESAEFKAAEGAVEAVGRTEDEIADLQKEERMALNLLGERVPSPTGANGPGTPERELSRAWDGHRLLAAEGSKYQEALESGVFTSTGKFGSVILGEIASRDQFAEFLSAVGSDNKLGATSADRRGFIQPLLKPLSLLDIIPTGTTDSNSVEYVQVTAVPTGAVETAELAAKPELGLTTVDATAPVRTIPGYVKLARQALDDISGLASLINTLLPYEVRRRIEAQILNGNGAGQNIRGIMQTSGIGAPDGVAGDNWADAILRAMTTVILSDGDPNFTALNPLTWQDILLMRENEAERTGAYIYGSPASMAAPTIWGLALTPNRTVPQASPLVGDANGATVLVREAVNVKVSDSDQDDFTKNRVTVLAEARIAFPVWRPASFAVATIEVTP